MKKFFNIISSAVSIALTIAYVLWIYCCMIYGVMKSINWVFERFSNWWDQLGKSGEDENLEKTEEGEEHKILFNIGTKGLGVFE